MRCVPLLVALLLLPNCFSGEELTPYQRALNEYNKNPRPDIGDMPGGSKFDNTILFSASSAFDSKASNYYRTLISDQAFSEPEAKNKLLSWYKGEYQRTILSLQTDAQRSHFKGWAERHYKYMTAMDMAADRANFIASQERAKQYQRAMAAARYYESKSLADGGPEAVAILSRKIEQLSEENESLRNEVNAIKRVIGGSYYDPTNTSSLLGPSINDKIEELERDQRRLEMDIRFR